MQIWLRILFVLLLASPAWAAPGAEDTFSSALAKGPGAAMVAAFAGGLLVSLTPCVYPMIAVTVSVFGARQSKSRLEGLLSSCAFVLGMAVMFVSLGLVAALTGAVFGSLLQSTWVVLGLSALFIVLALSMFGVFEFSLPSGLTNRLARLGGGGLRGAFVLGLVSGIVASPCTGPALTGILTFIATTQNLWFGTLAMSSFALGLGVPFFLVGAFALQLPKSGRWMNTVKAALGTVLLVVALYFASSKLPLLEAIVPRTASAFLWLVGGVAVGLLATLLVSKSAAGAPRLSRALAALAVIAFTYSGFGTVIHVTRTESPLAWEHQDLARAEARARAERRPLLVDFTANWCGACKELDRLTFSAPRVKAEAGRFVAVKIDASNDEDPRVVSAMRQLSVKGLPTVVLIDSAGREVRRFTDFVAAEPFLAALAAVE
jgi:thioredoxin:protein disulfide reductase